MHGLSVALEVAAAIAIVGALVAVATVRTHVDRADAVSGSHGEPAAQSPLLGPAGHGA